MDYWTKWETYMLIAFIIVCLWGLSITAFLAFISYGLLVLERLIKQLLEKP